MSNNVHYLPGYEREAVTRLIDSLASRAIEAGWKIMRRGVTYVQCTRRDGDHTEQISMAMIGTDFKASRVLILEKSADPDVVTDWLEHTP